MEFVAEFGAGAIRSSHAPADVERVCDYLIVLSECSVQVAGDVRELLVGHRRVVGTRADLERLASGVEVIRTEHSPGRNSAIARVDGALPIDAPWVTESVDLD